MVTKLIPISLSGKQVEVHKLLVWRLDVRLDIDRGWRYCLVICEYIRVVSQGGLSKAISPLSGYDYWTLFCIPRDTAPRVGTLLSW